MKIKKLLKVYQYNESGNVIVVLIRSSDNSEHNNESGNVIVDLIRSSYNSEHILFSGHCREIYCYYPDLLNLKIANFYFEGQFLKIIAYNEKEQ